MSNRLLTRLAVIVLTGIALQLLLPCLSKNAGLIVACLPIAVSGCYAAFGFRRQARQNRGRQRAGLMLGALAAGMLGVSYLFYTLDAVLGGVTLVSDMASFISIAAAVVVVPAILVAVPPFPNRLARITYAIDVTTVAGAIFATSWQFVLAPAASRLDAGNRAFFIVTVLPEVIAAALALMLMSRPAAGRYRSMRLLSAGLATFALAAIISTHNHVYDVPWYTNGLGAVYFVGGLIMGLASQTMVTRNDTRDDEAEPIAGSWSILPYLPVSVALTSVAVPYVHTGSLSPVLVWTLLSTSVLAMIRQFLNLIAVKALVTDLEEQRRRLDHQAHHDVLTGLPNRAAFYTIARTTLARTRPGSCTAVLLLDLDGFKIINDTYGHAAGDALLVETGARISAALRQQDTVARLGGDEFAIIITEVTDPADVAATGDRILAGLAEPMTIAGTTLFARGSVGVALAEGPGHDIDRVLHESDVALYAAKAAGKGVVRLAS
ncbi:diguanylate cyclase domain-containing protein [Actinoplanes sp. HUAS TT8]|uniref:diguanylate cyclase domain-containing protein n=1 Tax=Actinoplanes sp. HUAS TT8 TaxID=3447453 RepID=UPI003F5207DE